MINRVNFSVVPFPPQQWSGDVFQLAQLLAEHLQGVLDDSVFSGQTGGSEPTSNIGLWLNDDLWEAWDTDQAKYRPLRVAVGLFTNGVLKLATLLASNTAADITLTLPSKTGTLATLADILGGSATQTVTGNVSVDWTSRHIYTVISANVTITDAGGGADGQSVELWVETPAGHGTALTITFPAAWKWLNPNPVVLSTTDADHRAVDHIVIHRIGTNTFVSLVDSYKLNQTGGGGDHNAPVFSSANLTAHTAFVHVVFNETLQGNPSADTTAWIVRKDSNAQTITNVAISGSTATLTLSGPIGLQATVDVKYTGGGSVKDLAGNAAAAFTQFQPVEVIDPGGP